VLLAAAMHATWNALVKSSGDRLLAQALVIGVGALAGLCAIPFVPVPDPASWPFIAMSVAAHSGYYTFLLLAYRHGDLSAVYPLARGIAPLGVAALAALFAGERLGPWGAAGVLLVSAGIASLAFGRGIPRGRDGHPYLYAAVTGLFISAYTLIDGLGVRRAGTTLGFIAWLFLFESLPIVLVTAALRWRTVRRVPTREWRRGLFGGVIATVGYGIVIWAMSLDELARVVSLRETSVIMAALIGSLVLGEADGPRRIAAASLVALGNLLLRLFDGGG
jgi:drug/metabolite transporter (DMT)-like permease